LFWLDCFHTHCDFGSGLYALDTGDDDAIARFNATRDLAHFSEDAAELDRPGDNSVILSDDIKNLARRVACHGGGWHQNGLMGTLSG